MQIHLSPETVDLLRGLLSEVVQGSKSENSPEPLLTLNEAAEYLKVAPGTLKKWVEAKRLTYYKPGASGDLVQSTASPRFKVSDLEQFLQSKRVDPVRVSLHPAVRRA